jgi:hypothetical protein
MRRIDAALARIELAAGQPRQDNSAEAERLRAALAGAMTQIDGLITQIEKGSA